MSTRRTCFEWSSQAQEDEEETEIAGVGRNLSSLASGEIEMEGSRGAVLGKEGLWSSTKIDNLQLAPEWIGV